MHDIKGYGPGGTPTVPVAADSMGDAPGATRTAPGRPPALGPRGVRVGDGQGPAPAAGPTRRSVADWLGESFRSLRERFVRHTPGPGAARTASTAGPGEAGVRTRLLVADALAELARLPAGQARLAQAQEGTRQLEASLESRRDQVGAPFLQRQRELAARRDEATTRLAQARAQVDTLASLRQAADQGIAELEQRQLATERERLDAMQGKAPGAGGNVSDRFFRQQETLSELRQGLVARRDGVLSELASLKRALVHEAAALQQLTGELEQVGRDIGQTARQRLDAIDKDPQVIDLSERLATAGEAVAAARTTQLAGLNGLARSILAAAEPDEAPMGQRIQAALVSELALLDPPALMALASQVALAQESVQTYPDRVRQRDQAVTLDAQGRALVDAIGTAIAGTVRFSQLLLAPDAAPTPQEVQEAVGLFNRPDALLPARPDLVRSALTVPGGAGRAWLAQLPDEMLMAVHDVAVKSGAFTQASGMPTQPLLKERLDTRLAAMDRGIAASLDEFTRTGEVPLEGLQGLPADAALVSAGLARVYPLAQRNWLADGGSSQVLQAGRTASEKLVEALHDEGPAKFMELAAALIPLEQAIRRRAPSSDLKSAITAWVQPALEQMSAKELEHLAQRVETLKLFAAEDGSEFVSFARISLPKMIAGARRQAAVRASLATLEAAVAQGGPVRLATQARGALLSGDAALAELRAGLPQQQQAAVALDERWQAVCRQLAVAGLDAQGVDAPALLALRRILRPALVAAGTDPLIGALQDAIEPVRDGWVKHVRDACDALLPGAPGQGADRALRALDLARESQALYEAVFQEVHPDQSFAGALQAVVDEAATGNPLAFQDSINLRLSLGKPEFKALALRLRTLGQAPSVTGAPHSDANRAGVKQRLLDVAAYLDALLVHADADASPRLPRGADPERFGNPDAALQRSLGVQVVSGQPVDLQGMASYALGVVKEMFAPAAAGSQGLITRQAEVDFPRQKTRVRASAQTPPVEIRADTPESAARQLAQHLGRSPRRVWLASHYCNQESNQLATYLINHPDSPIRGINFTGGEQEVAYTLIPGRERDTIEVSYAVGRASMVGSQAAILETDPDRTFIAMRYRFSYDHREGFPGNVRLEGLPSVNFQVGAQAA